MYISVPCNGDDYDNNGDKDANAGVSLLSVDASLNSSLSLVVGVATNIIAVMFSLTSALSLDESTASYLPWEAL